MSEIGDVVVELDSVIEGIKKAQDLVGRIGRYNGWTNYETWVVGLWIGNEEETWNYYVEMARASSDVCELARKIRDDISDGLPDLDGMYEDLMGKALGNVDWQVIARNFMATVEEEKAYEERQKLV